MGWVLPATIAVASIVKGASQWSLQERQRREARQLAKIKTPKFEIPDAAQEAVNRARYRALAPYIHKATTQGIGATTANQVRNITETAGSSTDALSASAAAFGQQQDALVGQGTAAMEDFRRQQDNLQLSLGNMSEWEDKKAQWETRNPYLRAKASESALWAASDVNRMAAMDSFTTGAITAATAGSDLGLFGKKIPPTTGEGAGEINTGRYTVGGLSNQQKMQQFKLKYGYMPSAEQILNIDQLLGM